MCGFITVISKKNIPKSSIKRALEILKPRGPDAQNIWYGNSICMAHTRLSIIDLHARSNQPMFSKSNRYVIVFNGEIYNHKELRIKLESQGISFSTNSDTEVLLELYCIHGPSMLRMLRGMFSFVIWDKRKRKAFIARDPYGIKPLYYSVNNDYIIISSLVRAISASRLIPNKLDKTGIQLFWIFGSMPEPHTCFKQIKSLRAGNFSFVEDFKLQAEKSWFDLSGIWMNAKKSTLDKSKIFSYVRKALLDSVKSHLISDVPIGIFLSGGVDSNAILGLIHDLGIKDITAITVTYDEFINSSEDESSLAYDAAKKLGVRHIIRKVSKKEFKNDLPKIISSMDQPSIDGINVWYASKAASEAGLKVVFSGVGGDELFFGYDSFNTISKLSPIWKVISRSSSIYSSIEKIATWYSIKSCQEKWRYAPKYLKSISGSWLLRRSVNLSFSKKDQIFFDLDGNEPDIDLINQLHEMSGHLSNNNYLALSQIESLCYMRNQLLRDCDWAGMSHGVEIRTPLVDSQLISSLKFLLAHMPEIPKKKLLAYAPTSKIDMRIVNKRKTGFSIPTLDWWKDELSDEEISTYSRSNIQKAFMKYLYKEYMMTIENDLL